MLCELKETNPSMIMVDDESLIIEEDNQGQAIILGREFLGGYWLFKVQIENLILRIRHPLESAFQAGDRCTVTFRSGSQGILFPGSIPCSL